MFTCVAGVNGKKKTEWTQESQFERVRQIEMGWTDVFSLSLSVLSLCVGPESDHRKLRSLIQMWESLFHKIVKLCASSLWDCFPETRPVCWGCVLAGDRTFLALVQKTGARTYRYVHHHSDGWWTKQGIAQTLYQRESQADCRAGEIAVLWQIIAFVSCQNNSGFQRKASLLSSRWWMLLDSAHTHHLFFAAQWNPFGDMPFTIKCLTKTCRHSAGLCCHSWCSNNSGWLHVTVTIPSGWAWQDPGILNEQGQRQSFSLFLSMKLSFWGQIYRYSHGIVICWCFHSFSSE